MYYNVGAAIGGGIRATQGDIPGAVLSAASGLVPGAVMVAALPVAVNIGKWIGGNRNGPPEHVGYAMISNAQAKVTGQDDAYVYFTLDIGEQQDGYHLTQYRLNKHTGQVEYWQSASGMATPDWEHPETGDVSPAHMGYGRDAQWVPLEGVVQHGAGYPIYVVDPNAFGIHLYWDVLKPLGLEGLWEGSPPPQQVTPDMYQWQPRLESEYIPPEIAHSVEKQFASGQVPAVLPYYVKISNQGQVQGAYGAIPTDDGSWSGSSKVTGGGGPMTVTFVYDGVQYVGDTSTGEIRVADTGQVVEGYTLTETQDAYVVNGPNNFHYVARRKDSPGTDAGHQWAQEQEHDSKQTVTHGGPPDWLAPVWDEFVGTMLGTGDDQSWYETLKQASSELRDMYQAMVPYYAEQYDIMSARQKQMAAQPPVNISFGGQYMGQFLPYNKSQLAYSDSLKDLYSRYQNMAQKSAEALAMPQSAMMQAFTNWLPFFSSMSPTYTSGSIDILPFQEEKKPSTASQVAGWLGVGQGALNLYNAMQNTGVTDWVWNTLFGDSGAGSASSSSGLSSWMYPAASNWLMGGSTGTTDWFGTGWFDW